jgi:predicted ATPase/class 3 adenylate cyclase
MTFDEMLTQVQELLAREGRVSYRALKLRFNLDDEGSEGRKDELLKAKQLVRDEGGVVLVLTGGENLTEASHSTPLLFSAPTASLTSLATAFRPHTSFATPVTAERRQITVMFCDLVGSTALSAQLDPEELREVVHIYQTACTGVIERFAGHVAQYLGDGLLVYFGYPVAHEDDAQRAVRAGLGIIEALHELNKQLSHPLQVRIGIHTGLVVVGEVGGGEKRERLAFGEAPNLAARIQALAKPGTVVLSAVTQRLIQGFFVCQHLGPQALKDVATPISVYRVLGESGAQSRFEAAAQTGLTPLVGRADELALLQQRWEQAKSGAGQVVLLSGEPGIGKSRLVQRFKEQVKGEAQLQLECRCSPYYQNSALHPVITHLHKLLQFGREERPQSKFQKLERMLRAYQFPLTEAVPLLAALLSLPHPEGYPLLALSPQKQKQRTLEILLTWLLKESDRQPLCSVWEDLHWADPTTLELVGLLLEQASSARILMLATFRPEFLHSWEEQSHVSPLVLNRLGPSQSEEMIRQVTGGKMLPPEVVQQILVKADGVPLFLEELTKSVVEVTKEQGQTGWAVHAASATGLGIPSSLQEALLARLDRLSDARQVAQLGATLGREFSYELLRAVAPLSEAELRTALSKLSEAEILYQRGVGAQARYFFKHALIRDTAYQTLLKSTRQQHHQKIAYVLEEQFSDIKKTQPELLAHHYTEGGLITRAVSYWRQAGQRALEGSANAEAISHLTKALESLKALSDTSERARLELALHMALGATLQATKGYAAQEAAQAYTRARELCQQLGETPRLIQVLLGLEAYYVIRAELQTARELGGQSLLLAQRLQNLAHLPQSHYALEMALFHLGEFVEARAHFAQGIALYNPQKRRFHRTLQDPGVACLSYAAVILWSLGYPDHARKRIHEAFTLAYELSHPYSQIVALNWAAWLHQYRREGRQSQELAEAEIALANEQEAPFWVAFGTIMRGWALAEQGQGEEGVAEIRQGLAAWRATGAELARPYFLALLAEAHGKMGQIEEGLTALVEALDLAHRTGECFYEVELYRLKGELLLAQENQQAKGNSQKAKIGTDPGCLMADDLIDAELCFQQAIEIARRQHAKMWELRATVSLARLWRRQGRRRDARQKLMEIYHWFTEGFDTKDLREAQVLLEELA